MKNITAFITLILLSQSSFSQIYDCSECDSKIYLKTDISHLSLLELKILRNEIFARHQYIFKDERLGDYYSEKYDWYKPDYKSKKTIVLNKIEKENINLFLGKEKEKIILKETIIKNLKSFKQALLNDDTNSVNSRISNYFTESGYGDLSSTRRELKGILSIINIDGIHWYNESGLFKVTTDDGHFLNETSIKISGNKIVMTYADIGYSELLTDETAFSFGSNFYSENEYQSWYTFEIRNNELILVEHQAAG
ncbi:YARHG domain-containing protein [Olleya sp. ITB9]|uniref:YARHG domain-containing protein n=1 Tax=Olleya sp. ITB9 TaxID=1715648 RepID=UPI0006CFFAF9|nr:YARHG domain-containing protein [Olleya sp. ITB9]